MTTTSVDQGLAAAVDGVVHRALERAGRRLWSFQRRSARRPSRLTSLSEATYHTRPGVVADFRPGMLGPADSYHTRAGVDLAHVDRLSLLDGAFDRVPEIAARYGVDPLCLASTVEEYCRDLLTAGVAHDWRHIPGLLNSPCLLGAA